jgi:dolichol-phosphate mannosyltransferase
MSTRRYDTSQRAGPLGLRNRRLHEDRTRLASEILVIKREAAERTSSFLSVVVAAKNEAPNLPQLVGEIALALRPLCNNGLHGLAQFEIVIVDDASTDGTGLVLSDLREAYPELRGLMLAPGVGQSSATVAGIHAARGNWIATLDADLQNDPADLVRLWKALPGFDAALGWRVTRQDICSKRVISRWSNRVRNMLLGQSIHDTGCSVRIFPRAIALRLPTFHGMHRFFGPLLLREGCRLIQVPVNHRPRLHGWSHYNLWNRSLCVIIDLFGVTWLMHRPVRYRVIQTLQSWEVIDGSEFADVVRATAHGQQEG